MRGLLVLSSLLPCERVVIAVIGTLWPIDDNVDKMMSELPRYSQAPTDFTKALGLVHVTDLSCPRVTFQLTSNCFQVDTFLLCNMIGTCIVKSKKAQPQLPDTLAKMNGRCVYWPQYCMLSFEEV